MSEEQVVRAKYPQAEVQFNKPVAGADLGYDRDGHYAVYAGPGLGTSVLGRGPTEAEAWAAAAATAKAN